MVWIALGGALGAMARFGAWSLVKRFWTGTMPYGTWLANLLGCFIIGLLLPYWDKTTWSEEFRFFMATGFLGSFTTFSTFSLESAYLWQRGEIAYALLNVIGSVGLGLVFVLLGMWLGKTFFPLD